MVFTNLLLENALAIRHCNCEAASEPLLPKVVRCIPVLPSRYIGKCAARVLKRSGYIYPHLLLSPSRFQNSLSTFSIERVNGIPLLDFLPERFSKGIENNNHSRIIYRNEKIARVVKT